MTRRGIDGFVLLEVLLAASVLAAGLAALFGALSGARKCGRASETLTQNAFRLESGIWAWEITGRWRGSGVPGDLDGDDFRNEEAAGPAGLRGTLFVRTGPSAGDEFSLSGYR